MPRIKSRPRYVPLKTVAQMTGLGRDTLRKRVHEGEFGDFILDPTAGAFVQLKEVDRWVEARTIKIRVRPPGPVGTRR